MADLQDRVTDILEDLNLGKVERNIAPIWLVRPGKAEAGRKWALIQSIYGALTEGASLPDLMPPRETRRVDALLYPQQAPPRVVEIDESQHFNRYRALTLRMYPANMDLGFPKHDWLARSESKERLEGGGWGKAKPPLFPMEHGRHRQRAFRDALADLLPAAHGFGPTVRIGDFELEDWIWSASAEGRLLEVLVPRMRLQHQFPKVRELVRAEAGATASGPLTPSSAAAGGADTQPVTVADKAGGRIRLPRPAKAFFPSIRTTVDIVLQGVVLRARYDPRLGPDRERSGVLLVGRDAVSRITTGRVLVVSLRGELTSLD